MEKPTVTLEMSLEAFTVLDCLAGIGLAVLAVGSEQVEPEKASKDVQENMYVIASSPQSARAEVADKMKAATAEVVEWFDKQIEAEKKEK